MKNIFSIICFLSLCSSVTAQKTTNETYLINKSLTRWHKAATDADFNAYFDLMTEDAVFIGTDATENWQLADFKTFSKPYFDKGKAWSFTTLERNTYLDPSSAKTAWFDELLSTQMGICRGSGVLKKVGDLWKVQHYVLSIAVPNENVSTLTEMKKDWDKKQIELLIKKENN